MILLYQKLIMLINLQVVFHKSCFMKQNWCLQRVEWNSIFVLQQYKNIVILLNPSRPDVIFYTYTPRGGEFSPPLVKWCFAIENLHFSSCGEILQNFSMISRSNTKLKPNFKEFLEFLAWDLVKFQLTLKLSFMHLIYF